VSTWTIAECPDCSVQSARPRPPRQAIREYYANAEIANDYEMEYYVEPLAQRKTGDVKLVEQIERLVGTRGRMLEVGPAAGWLLKAARDRGWSVAGIEAAPKFHRYATETLGLPVHLGDVEECYRAVGYAFDVVVIKDTLEHVYDPVSDLALLRSLLKPTGVILIETPNIGALAAKVYGLRWRQIVASHTFYWTKRSLETALNRAGLRARQWSHPRRWDPDPRREMMARVREVIKFVARAFLVVLYVRPSRRWRVLRALPALITKGRLSYPEVRFKVGDQPVIGDVLLCIAEVAPTSAVS
jgi:2-polyprenyl-3-methyl-5-hydroxy-6-metoxy-1,4-benzoquinol methylase